MGVVREVLVPLIAPQAPSHWKVPDGQQAYSVRADQNNGHTIEFFATIDPTKPETLMAGILEVLPNTVWYDFEPTSPKVVSGRGKEIERQRASRKLMNMFELITTLKETGKYGR